MDDDLNIKNISDIPARQAAIVLLDQAGYKNHEIAKALHIHDTYPSQIKTKLKKYSLTSPKIVRSAHKAIKEIIEMVPYEAEKVTIDKATGQPITYIDKIYPTQANRLQASAMVMDRYDPPEKDQNKQAPQIVAAKFTINIGKEELSKYIDVDAEIVK